MSNADQAKLIARTWEEMDPFDKAEMGWEARVEGVVARRIRVDGGAIRRSARAQNRRLARAGRRYAPARAAGRVRVLGLGGHVYPGHHSRADSRRNKQKPLLERFISVAHVRVHLGPVVAATSSIPLQRGDPTASRSRGPRTDCLSTPASPDHSSGLVAGAGWLRGRVAGLDFRVWV